MSKGLETISVLDDYLIVDTTNRRVCEVSNPTYDRMFKGSRFANEMATLLVEYRNRIAELEEQLAHSIRPKFKVNDRIFVIVNNETEEYYVDEVLLKVKGTLVAYRDICKETTITEKNELFATYEEAEAKLSKMCNLRV
jgi:hypothetical protein